LSEELLEAKITFDFKIVNFIRKIWSSYNLVDVARSEGAYVIRIQHGIARISHRIVFLRFPTDMLWTRLIKRVNLIKRSNDELGWTESDRTLVAEWTKEKLAHARLNVLIITFVIPYIHENYTPKASLVSNKWKLSNLGNVSSLKTFKNFLETIDNFIQNTKTVFFDNKITILINNIIIIL